MASIFWDTMLFIYTFEDHPAYADRVVDLRRRMLERGDQLFTSALAVGEIQVKPAEAGDRELMERYREAFRSPAITVIPFDLQAAEFYARIRADRTIARPDAIHLACAASRNINLFITNDKRLLGKNIPGIDFIASLETAPI
jgi:predicted nucleic acid-binding protein